MKTFVLVVAATVYITNANLLTAESKHSNCKEWNAKVDPAVPGKTAVNVSELSDNEVTTAIGCLLKNRGNRANALIGGATNLMVSALLPQATVELASLYYISYLFTGDYEHGDGIALWDDHGAINPPGSIDRAYDAYEAWYKRVKLLGIGVARKQHLNPLSGTNLKWYGK